MTRAAITSGSSPVIAHDVVRFVRLLHQHELMQHMTAPEDRRKFEARLPNDIWQSDVMHGPKVPVDQKYRKTYLIAFIDDHSRLIVHGSFYLSENLFSFMDAFEKALAKRGLPIKKRCLPINQKSKERIKCQ